MGVGASASFADRELEAASVKGNLPRVKFLLEKDGAHVDYKDDYGWTALLHATSEGHLEVVKYLISKGASAANTTFDGSSVLHHAVTSQNDTLLSFLLQYNACDVNGKNESGWTPLHLACLSGQQNAVKLLLAHGADQTLVNSEGKRPSDLTTIASLRSFMSDYEILPPNYKVPEETTDDYNRPPGMQETLHKLQTLQSQPRAPVEMKGYTYLDDEGSTDDLTLPTTTHNTINNNTNNNKANGHDNSDNNNSYNNNNNNHQKQKEKAKGEEIRRANGRDPQTELKKIIDAIKILREIDPEKLSMVQMQELIEFHGAELRKYTEAKKILEEIRAREEDLLMAD